MDSNQKRGRPKTLQRDHVLSIAMMSYWYDGPTNVSIGEICQRANISKPGLYREFGSDDGLKVAVLETYQDLALAPLRRIFEGDNSTEDTLNRFIEYTLQEREAHGIPKGCLHVEMRAHQDELGDLTRQKSEQLRQSTLAAYATWAEQARLKGELSSDISPEVAALYIDSQNRNAMRLQREEVPREKIETLLRLALSALRQA